MQGVLADDRPRAAHHGPASEASLVTHSPPMRELDALIDAVAPSDCPVLITGETGTGKERVARALHQRSRRGRHRLVAMHCAAVPPTLLERELFGHERGAFTGAGERRQGVFEAAHGGTFLLDEIGELEPRLQAKLLRVLQEKEILRLGSTEPTRVDVRVLAATNCDLRAAVEARGFRPDLFYRLNTVELHVPPLRERREDILALCREFLVEAAEADGAPPRQLSPAAAAHLFAYPWPGNVRELRSVVQRACLLCDGPRVEAQHLPAKVLRDAQRPAPPGPPSPAPQEALLAPVQPPDFREARRQFERRYFLQALAAAEGNISAAARGAGLSWKHFRHKMHELNIRPDAWTHLPAPEPAS
ncbi:MAG: sigma-54 interaction domain-containing protein [Candidatus Brocadiia bacterium]